MDLAADNNDYITLYYLLDILYKTLLAECCLEIGDAPYISYFY